MKTFGFPPDTVSYHIEEFLYSLLQSTGFFIKAEQVLSISSTFYDTFDWRLYGKSLTLEKRSHELYLRRLPEGEIDQRQETSKWGKIVSNLPESALRDQLVVLTSPRALLVMAEITVELQTFRILNKDQKTVLFLDYSEISKTKESTSPLTRSFLELYPVRGYLKPARIIENSLSGAGFIKTSWQDFYESALAFCGSVPGSYTSKIMVDLDPSMRADQATSLILLRLLEVIRANETGIRSDIDIEFLHDFRVAIRRTRSTLGQVRNVYPSSVTERFKQDFSALGRSTNQLRDLDVYLLSENEYRAMLPESIRDEITPLFDYLRTQRSQALQDVISFLDTDEYAQILQEWKKFLTGVIEKNEAPRLQEIDPGDDAINASLPIIELAKKRIYSRYRRVIKDGNILLENPVDAQMHALRIDCKKLRYLLEFFESLFPPESVSTLVSQLKKLQDNLGEFNDLSVQQTYLLDVANHLPIRRKQTRNALVATGVLVNKLYERQQDVRNEFGKIFTEFSSPENRLLFKKVFASGKVDVKSKIRVDES